MRVGLERVEDERLELGRARRRQWAWEVVELREPGVHIVVVHLIAPLKRDLPRDRVMKRRPESPHVGGR